jgi:DNA-binding response OmpR family regulator
MSQKRQILIVEDDLAQRGILVELLADKFEISVAATLREADDLLEAAGDARFDLLLLDLGMPDGSGHEYCVKLRRQGYRMPIIILTGSDDEDDIVRGFDAGASDYLTKPYRLNELLARLRTQLRMFDDSEHASFTIGPYEFRPSAKLLINHLTNRRLRLTDKETAILKYLYRAGQQSVTRPVLLEEVWGYNSGVTTHTLETHIYRLRQKIEANPGNCRLLVTESGGYRLNLAMAA